MILLTGMFVIFLVIVVSGFFAIRYGIKKSKAMRDSGAFAEQAAKTLYAIDSYRKNNNG